MGLENPLSETLIIVTDSIVSFYGKFSMSLYVDNESITTVRVPTQEVLYGESVTLAPPTGKYVNRYFSAIKISFVIVVQLLYLTNPFRYYFLQG